MPDEQQFLADEGVDFRLVSALREEGYDLRAIAEEIPGVTDDEVLDFAVETDRVLLTEDKDFGEMVFRRGLQLPGVVVIRLHGLTGAEKIRIIRSAFSDHSLRFRRAFSVVTEKAVRIRAVD